MKTGSLSRCLELRRDVLTIFCHLSSSTCLESNSLGTRMWANAQCDGRPAYYRWRPLLNAAVWLTPTTSVPCSNAAKTWNPLKFARVPQTHQQISAVSRPKFTVLWGHVEEVSMFNRFFRLSIHASVAKTQPDKVLRWCQNGDFFGPVFAESRVPHISEFRPAF